MIKHALIQEWGGNQLQASNYNELLCQFVPQVLNPIRAYRFQYNLLHHFDHDCRAISIYFCVMHNPIKYTWISMVFDPLQSLTLEQTIGGIPQLINLCLEFGCPRDPISNHGGYETANHLLIKFANKWSKTS